MKIILCRRNKLSIKYKKYMSFSIKYNFYQNSPKLAHNEYSYKKINYTKIYRTTQQVKRRIKNIYY